MGDGVVPELTVIPKTAEEQFALLNSFSPERVEETRHKAADKCTDEDRLIQAGEMVRCTLSYPHFLMNYVQVQVPPKHGEALVMNDASFKVLTPHTKKAVWALMNRRLIVWMKSRQVWASTIMSSYDVWLARFKKSANVLVFSKGEKEVGEKIRKCRFIYTHLPDWMQVPINPDSTMQLGFPMKGVESRIEGFPATPDAGVSYTATLIDCDEWAVQEYARDNFLNSAPTIEGGGQFVGTFTPTMNGTSYAEEVFKDAVNWPNHKIITEKNTIIVDHRMSKNGFYPIFDPWWVVPGRTKSWYQSQKAMIPTGDLQVLTPDLYMAKAFPGSIEEALSSPTNINAFDHKQLDLMMGDTRNPLIEPVEGLDRNVAHIYKKRMIGHTYVAGTDTAHGIGQDYSVTAVIDLKSGEVVADVFSNVIPPEVLAQQSYHLLKEYGWPKWWIEDNEWGRVTINMAADLEYRNLGYQDEAKSKPGFKTNSGTRFEVWGDLISGINNGQVIIYSKEGLQHFYDVVRNPDKEGRIEAKRSGHDDYPMAVGIAWIKRGDSITTEWTPRVISSLTFERDQYDYAEPGVSR